MTYLLLSTAWIICGVWAYRIRRGYYKKMKWTWTRAVRLQEIIFTLLASPLNLIINLFTYSTSLDKEAKW